MGGRGETPLVVGLGLLNLVMVLLFKRVGGMDFRAPRRPLGIRARRTMGRKIAPGHRYDSGRRERASEATAEGPGRDGSKAKAAADAATKAGQDPVAAAKAAGGEIVYETVPATIRFLEMFPWMCSKLYPLLFWYAVVFAVPCVRAAYCAWENGNIKRRNNARRERAGAALREIVAARRREGEGGGVEKKFHQNRRRGRRARRRRVSLIDKRTRRVRRLNGEEYVVSQVVCM